MVQNLRDVKSNVFFITERAICTEKHTVAFPHPVTPRYGNPHPVTAPLQNFPQPVTPRYRISRGNPHKSEENNHPIIYHTIHHGDNW
jgi:hypothetical protein